MSMWNYWTESGREGPRRDKSKVVGYDVIATDGDVGEVTEESVDVDSSHLVVDTGFWILDRKRLIPAGAVTRVDHEAEKIVLSMSKDEIRHAPDYVEESRIDEDEPYRELHTVYYRPWTVG